jgi:hypothetical protein
LSPFTIATRPLSYPTAYKQPIVYNLSVAKEVLKQIYIKEGLAPPSLDAFRAAYSSMLAQVSNPQVLGNLVRSGEIGRVGVYGLQAYGIFKVCTAFSNILPVRSRSLLYFLIFFCSNVLPRPPLFFLFSLRPFCRIFPSSSPTLMAFFFERRLARSSAAKALLDTSSNRSSAYLRVSHYSYSL